MQNDRCRRYPKWSRSGPTLVKKGAHPVGANCTHRLRPHHRGICLHRGWCGGHKGRTGARLDGRKPGEADWLDVYLRGKNRCHHEFEKTNNGLILTAKLHLDTES